MSGKAEREAGRERAWATARIFCGQGAFIGMVVSLCLFLTEGVDARSAGYLVLASACAVGLVLLRRQGRGR